MARAPMTAPTFASEPPATPFAKTEDVWFWYVRCQIARDAGARFVAGLSETPRPCEPDDIYRAVRRLWLTGALTRRHVRTLFDYGFRETPPDPRCREEAKARRSWEEALDRLATPLKAKGILDEATGQ